MAEIIVAKDAVELSEKATETFVWLANEAIDENGRFTVSLAGGSTPKRLYHLLTTSKYRNRVDWTKVFFFFGDERNMPPDSDESNFRMADETLFTPLGILNENVFRWQTELQMAEDIAENYEKSVRGFFSTKPNRVNSLPRFDLIFLGMGTDGHTASLFPYTSALNETKRIAVENWVEKLGVFRLTLTFPVFNNAANIIFFVTGAEKAEPLKDVLESEPDVPRLPVQGINPASGRIIWYADEAAAKLLAR